MFDESHIYNVPDGSESHLVVAVSIEFEGMSELTGTDRLIICSRVSLIPACTLWLFTPTQNQNGKNALEKFMSPPCAH